MSDEVIQKPTGTVGVSHKVTVSDGNYGSTVTEGSIYLPFEVGDTLEQTETNIEQAYLTAKVHLYSQLGVDIEQGADGIVRPKAPPVPEPKAVTRPSPVRAAAPQGGSRPSGGGGGGAADHPILTGRIGNGQRTIVKKRILDADGEKVPNPSWLDAQIEAACAKAGVERDYEVWDNRETPEGPEGRRPWFKTVNVKVVDKNGREGGVGIWPPESGGGGGARRAPASRVDAPYEDEEPF